MPIVEWNTPLVNPVQAIRWLQYAANSLTFPEWAEAMHFPADEYAKAKFLHLQVIGKHLPYFDDGVLRQTLDAYDRQLERRANAMPAREGASQAVPSRSEFDELLDHCEAVMELPVDGPRVLYAAECDDIRKLLRMVRGK